MHPLEEHPVVFVGGHPQRRVPHSTVGAAAVRVWPRCSLARADHDHISAVPEGNPFDCRKRRGIEGLELCAQVLDCALGDLLASHCSRWCDAEHDLPAALVQEGANGLGGFATGPGCPFELEDL